LAGVDLVAAERPRHLRDLDEERHLADESGIESALVPSVK
jgi:hypothetical protein